MVCVHCMMKSRFVFYKLFLGEHETFFYLVRFQLEAYSI